jgi:hypothetical protein
MITINTTSYATKLPIYKNDFSLFWDYYSNLKKIVFHYITIRNIILPYKLVKPKNSLKVKTCPWNEIKSNVYIVVQIQLKCTYGSTFIYLISYSLNI